MKANRAPNKLTGPVHRALELLSVHHSNAQYKEMAYHWKGHSPHQWAAWSPQLPKSAQPRRKTKDDKNQKDKKEGVVKPYDSTSTSAGGSALSDGQSTEMVFMKEFLNFMKESGTEVPERFQKFMPNDKMADIRLQQKKLNKQRNVAQKIDNKRKAIERDAEQWTQWLVKMREEIQAEKDKHIANQERLNKELEQLLEEQKNLAKDDDVEEATKTEEMEVEDSLEALLQTDVSTEPNVQQIQPVVCQEDRDGTAEDETRACQLHPSSQCEARSRCHRNCGIVRHRAYGRGEGSSKYEHQVGRIGPSCWITCSSGSSPIWGAEDSSAQRQLTLWTQEDHIGGEADRGGCTDDGGGADDEYFQEGTTTRHWPVGSNSDRGHGGVVMHNHVDEVTGTQLSRRRQQILYGMKD